MRILQTLISGFGLWISLAGIALWQLNAWPRTLLAWVLVLMVGPLVTILLEAVGEAIGEVFSRLPMVRRPLDRVGAETAAKQFSWKRIGVMLGVMLPFLLVGLTLVLALSGRRHPVMSNWWHHNFG